MMTLYDAAGLTVAVSQVAGNGAVEEIVIPAGTPGRLVQVDRQAGPGSGTYRLEVAPVAGLRIAPDVPLAPGPRAGGASSTGDGCHPKRQPRHAQSTRILEVPLLPGVAPFLLSTRGSGRCKSRRRERRAAP